MGSSVQKILQGRSNQKRGVGRVKSVIRRILLPSLLVLLYTAILLTPPAPGKRSFSPLIAYLWFSLSLLCVVAYSYISLKRRKKGYLFETLTSYLLFIGGSIHLLDHSWLHIAYIPILVSLSFGVDAKIMIPLSLVVPFLEVHHLRSGNRIEEVFFSGATVLTVAVLSLFLAKNKKQHRKLKESLEAFEEEVEGMTALTSTDPAGVEEGLGQISERTQSGRSGSDTLFSQYRLFTERANREIGEVLMIAKDLISGDSARMFEIKERSLYLRCSTDESATVEVPADSLIRECIERRETLTHASDPGGRSGVVSHLATPIIDGNFVTGVLVVSRKKENAFRDNDIKMIRMFSHQILRILQIHRIHLNLKKEDLMFKNLEVGSKKLISSLKAYSVAGSFIEVVHSIAPQKKVSIALFVPRGDRFEIIRQVGFVLTEGDTFDFRDTLIGSICKMKSQTYSYISDLDHSQAGQRIPIAPFNLGDEGSVFMLPLLYERDLLGILVYVTPKPNALRFHQIQLIEVLGNLVSSSLANAKLHGEIEKMAVTDGLTGLFNHRHFQEKLEGEFKRLQRQPNPLSLLLIDIDFFKKINDSYGHPGGDEVLRNVAAVIKKTVRDVDIPARYGGEEFAAILLGTNHDGARKMAERLRKSVQDKTFLVDGRDVTVTVSIGSATSHGDGETKEQLIERADQALYHAKRNGRNRSVLWDDIK